MKTALLACLFALPAAAGEVYLQGGIAHQFQHSSCRYPGWPYAVYCDYDRTIYAPTLGHAELGYSVTQGRWTGQFYLRHESVINRQDFGVNQAGAALRVSLWKN